MFVFIKLTRKCIAMKEYDVGEHVFARWSDCRMYPAVIRAVNHDGELWIYGFVYISYHLAT